MGKDTVFCCKSWANEVKFCCKSWASGKTLATYGANTKISILFWQAGKGVQWDSNPWPPEPQPGTLPTELYTPCYIVPAGLEPTPPDPKSSMLPLHHGTMGTEAKGVCRFSEPMQSTDSAKPPFLCFVMRVGFEPTTWCSVDICSDPIELPHQSFAEVSTTHPYFLVFVWRCKGTKPLCSLFA